MKKKNTEKAAKEMANIARIKNKKHNSVEKVLKEQVSSKEFV